MPAVDDERVTVDGVSLHYLHAGAAGAPPVLLLHGGIIDAAHVSWGDLVGPLAADFEVFALDLPGYGRSEKPDAPYTMAYHVGAVGGFLEAVDAAPAHVVGASLGGGIGLGLSLATDAVDRLVLVDSYGLGRELPNGWLTYLLAKLPGFNRLSVALLRRSRRLTRASLGNVVHDVDVLPESVVDEVHELLQEPDVARAFRRWREHEVTRSGYRTAYVDQFGEIEAPTLLIHGVEDDIFPVAWAERAAREIPDADIERYEDCAHWPPRERPERFLSDVRDFLPAE